MSIVDDFELISSEVTAVDYFTAAIKRIAVDAKLRLH